jgi:hypothetical protein
MLYTTTENKNLRFEVIHDSSLFLTDFLFYASDEANMREHEIIHHARRLFLCHYATGRVKWSY